MLISFGDSERGDEFNDKSIYTTKYRFEENDFPWGLDGVEIGTWRVPEEDRISNSTYGDPFETTDGNILIAMSDNPYTGITDVDLVKLNQEGEITDRSSIELEPNGLRLKAFLAPAVDGGFWYYGAPIQYHPDPPFRILTWFTADARPGIEQYIETSLPQQDGLWTTTLWTDLDDNYHILIPQRVGFRRLAFSPEGQPITPLEGELVKEENLRNSTYQISLIHGNSIFQLWETSTWNLANLASFDLEGNHEWTIDIECETYFFDEYFSLTAIPGERALLVGALDKTDDEFTPILIKINADNGDVVWREHEASRRVIVPRRTSYRKIIVNDGYIYDAFYPTGDQLRVHKYNGDGEDEWRRRVYRNLEEDVKFCGMVPTSTGGVYIGLYHESGDSINAWALEVTPDGDFEDSLSFFVEYNSNIPRGERDGPKFDLSRSQENIWLVPRDTSDDSLGVAQGLREDGTLLIWSDEGYHPPPQDETFARISGGITDGAGGLWLLYYYPTITTHNGPPYAIWLQPEPGYPNHSLRLVDNPILSGLNSYFAMDNGDLVTISCNRKLPSLLQHTCFSPAANSPSNGIVQPRGRTFTSRIHSKSSTSQPI